MRWLRVIFSLLIVAVLVGAPLLYSHRRRDQSRNFHVVREGVLYRSGQLTRGGLARLIHEYGIKSVVTLRFSKVPGTPPPDIDEEDFCKRRELQHFRLPSLAWWSSVGPIPADKNVEKFLKIVKDPANQPVLVHCYAGMHRTGTLCAVFRMELDGWSSADAIREMKHFGYVEEDMDVLTYLKNYRPMGPGHASEAASHE